MLSLVIPSNLQRSKTRCDSRFAPRSERSASGTLNQGMTSSAMSWAILVALWSGTGNTKGHFVNKS